VVENDRQHDSKALLGAAYSHRCDVGWLSHVPGGASANGRSDQSFVWTKTEQVLAKAIKDQATSGTLH
jgi:hypothetical protein